MQTTTSAAAALPDATPVKAPAWTSLSIDQRIVDSMMTDDTAVFRELSARGVNNAAVFARARVIGVTRQFIKDCRLSGSRPALRNCVACEHVFLSAGVHNRMCRRCITR